MKDRARKLLASALSAFLALGGWPASAQPHLVPAAAAARPPLMPPREAARALESWRIFRDKPGQRDKLRGFLIKDGRPTLLGWVVYRRLERWARQGLDEEFSQELGAMLPDFEQLRESGAFTDARQAKLQRALSAQEAKLGRIDKAAAGANTLEGEFQRSELYAAVIANLAPPAVSGDEKTFVVEDRGGRDVLSAKSGEVISRTDSRGVVTWSRQLRDLQRRAGLPATGQYNAAMIEQEVEPSRKLCADMRRKLDDDEVLTMSDLLGQGAQNRDRVKDDKRLRAEVIAQAKRTKYFHQNRELSIYDEVEGRLAERRGDLKRAEDGLEKLESQARLIEDRMKKAGLADIRPIQNLDVMSSYVRRWTMAAEADWQIFHIRELRQALDPDSPDAENIREAIGALPMDPASRSLYIQRARAMNDELEAARQKVERTLLLLRAGESPASLRSAVYSIMATRRIISRLQMRQILYAQIPLTAVAADQAVIDRDPWLSAGTLAHGGARMTRGALGFVSRGYARNMDAVRLCRAQLATVTRLIADGREDEAIHSMSLMRGGFLHSPSELAGVPGAQAAMNGLQDCQDRLRDVMVPNKWMDSIGNLATWSAEVALTGPLAGKFAGAVGRKLGQFDKFLEPAATEWHPLVGWAPGLLRRGVRVAGAVLEDASGSLRALDGDSSAREAGWSLPRWRIFNPLRRFVRRCDSALDPARRFGQRWSFAVKPLGRFGRRWGVAFKRQLGFSATMGIFSSVLSAFSETKALVLGDREPFKGGWFWGNLEAMWGGLEGGVWSTSDLANNNHEWWWLLMPYFNSALPARALKGMRIPILGWNIGRAAEVVASGGPTHWVREFFTDSNLAVEGAAGKVIEEKARDGALLGFAKGIFQHTDNYLKYYLFDRATTEAYKWHIYHSGPHTRMLGLGFAPEWGKWGGMAENPDYERMVKTYNKADETLRRLPLPLWVLIPGAGHLTPEQQAALAGDARLAVSEYVAHGIPEQAYGVEGEVKPRLDRDRGTLVDKALSFHWIPFLNPPEGRPGTFTVSGESNRALLRHILNPALSILDLITLAQDPEEDGLADNTSLATLSLPSNANALAHPEREAAGNVVTSADVRSVASTLLAERLAEHPEEAFTILERPAMTKEEQEQHRQIEDALITGRREIAKRASPEIRRRLAALAEPYLKHERLRNAAGERFVKAAKRLPLDSPGFKRFQQKMMERVWSWLDGLAPGDEDGNKEALLEELRAMERAENLNAREKEVVNAMFDYIQAIDEHGFNAFNRGDRPAGADQWLIHDALGRPIPSWRPGQFAAFLDGLTLFAAGSRADGVPRFFEQLSTGGGKTLLKFIGFLPLVRASARAAGRGILSLTTQASLDAQDRANFRAYRITDTDVTFALYDELAGKMAQAEMSGRDLNRYFVIGDEIDGALLQPARSIGRRTGTIANRSPVHGLVREVENSLSAHLGLAEGAPGDARLRERAAKAMKANFDEEARLRRLVGEGAAARVKAAGGDPRYAAAASNHAAGRLLEDEADRIVAAVRAGDLDEARTLLAERRVRAEAFVQESNPAYQVYADAYHETAALVLGPDGVRRGQDPSTEAHNREVADRFRRYQDGVGGLRGLLATARLIGHALLGGFFEPGREAPQWTREAAGAARWHAARLLRRVIESAAMPDHEKEQIAGRLWRSLLLPGGGSFMRTELARMFMGHLDDGAGFHYDSGTGRVFVDMNGSWHPTMDSELLRFWELRHGADLTMPYEHAASVTTERSLATDREMPVLVLSGSVGDGPRAVLEGPNMGFTISGRGSRFPLREGEVVVTPERVRAALNDPSLSLALRRRLQPFADAPAPTTLPIARQEQPGNEFDQWLRKPGNSRPAYDVHVSAYDTQARAYARIDQELSRAHGAELLTLVVPDLPSLEHLEAHLLRQGLAQSQIAKVYSDVEYLRNHVPGSNVRERQNLKGLDDGSVRVFLIQADYARGGDWNFKGGRNGFRGYTDHRMFVLGSQNMAPQDLLQAMGRISLNRVVTGAYRHFELLLDMGAVRHLDVFDQMLHGQRHPEDARSLFGELAADAVAAGYDSSWAGINRLVNAYRRQPTPDARTWVDWYENRLWETLHDKRQAEIGARKLSRSGSGAQPAVDRGHELYRGLDGIVRQSRARD